MWCQILLLALLVTGIAFAKERRSTTLRGVYYIQFTSNERQDLPQTNYGQRGRDRPLTIQRLAKSVMESSFIGCATNISKYHTTNEEIIKLVRMLMTLPYNVLHSDPGNTCVLDCALKRVGLMNDFGGIITDGIFKALVTQIPIKPAQDYLVAEYDKCATRRFIGTDPCKTASNFIFCFFVMGSTVAPALKLARSVPALFNTVQNIWSKIPVLNIFKLPTLPTPAPTAAPTPAPPTAAPTAPPATTAAPPVTKPAAATTAKTDKPTEAATTASTAVTTAAAATTAAAVTTAAAATTAAAVTTVDAATTTAAATTAAAVTTVAAATTVAPKA